LTAPVSGADKNIALAQLRAINPATVTSAYVLWRLSSSFSLLGAAEPAALTNALRKAKAPKTLHSVQNVLDEQGYLELAAMGDVSVPSKTQTLVALKSRLSSTDAGDDLVVSSLVRSCHLLGQAPATVSSDLSQRRDSRTGLLREPTTVQGSIEATYDVAQLIPQDFSKIAGSSTRNALKHFLHGQRSAAPLDRLEAAASLKMAGDPAWKDYATLVSGAEEGLGSLPVNSSNLVGVVQLIDVLRVLDTNVPTPTLVEFAGEGSEGSYLARVALGNRDMFANSEKIGTWFASTQASLLSASKEPSEPTILYFSGLQALSGAKTLTPTRSDQQAISAGLEQLRGCTGFPDLYRNSIANHAACSLQATRFAIDSSYAYGD
jgi:hypothetical protein